MFQVSTMKKYKNKLINKKEEDNTKKWKKIFSVLE